MLVSTQRRRSRSFWFAIAATICTGVTSSMGLADPLQERLRVCGACHGEDGNSKMDNTPSLAGQPELFLTNQLIMMRERVRRSEVMEPFVKGLKDEEIIALAAHYAKLKPKSGDEPVDAAAVARGAELALQLRCGSCHLQTYEGYQQMPRLVPQRLDYLIKSLTEYRDGKRYGIDTSMNGVMYRVPDRDIRALAHYLVSLR
jgi:cytochrome c553